MQIQARILKLLATISTLLSCQTLSFSTPRVLAQTSPSQQLQQAKSSQANHFEELCPSPASAAILRVKTEHYWVSICSTEGKPDHPKYYVDREIDGSNSVTLPLSIYPFSKEDLKIYTAQNGKYLYTLNFDNRATQCSHGCLIITLPDGKHLFEAVIPDRQ